MITVNTSAESRNLTTLESVMQVITNPDPSEHETLLETLITRASVAVERFCGRVFAREDITETIEGSGRIELILDRTPIISVAEVTLNGDPVSDVIISDRDVGAIFLQTGFQRDDVLASTLITPWPSGQALKSWDVTYIGGYWLPSFTEAGSGAKGAAEIDLPADLEGLVIDLVASMFVEVISERRPSDVVSEKLGDWSATYKVPADQYTRMPKQIQAELERNWRRVVIA